MRSGENSHHSAIATIFADDPDEQFRAVHSRVVEFVAARASENLTKLRRTTGRPQQFQSKAIGDIKYQQVSIGSGTRFGTRFPT